MRILVFGAGVIGTIYGYVLSKAGHEVIHYVRQGKSKTLQPGINLFMVDGRQKKAPDISDHYSIKLTETLSSNDKYDLVIVSVRHYQLDSVLPVLKEGIGNATILFFNGNWSGLQNVDQYFSRSQYLWGFPVAGGGYTGLTLNAALLEEIRLGEIDGEDTERLHIIKKAFEDAGLKVDTQKGILSWLWVHFAINCGIIGAAFKAGGASALLNSVSHLRTGILAGREALTVCEKRGVDIKKFPDAKAFSMPSWIGAFAVWLMMKTNRPARKIMETHTAIDELQKMYFDLLETAEELHVPMKNYKKLKSYVDVPQIRA
jgi:2-dehydropantoate 2-reductase